MPARRGPWMARSGSPAREETPWWSNGNSRSTISISGSPDLEFKSRVFCFLLFQFILGEKEAGKRDGMKFERSRDTISRPRKCTRKHDSASKP